MTSSRHAIPAQPADDVPFTRNKFSGIKVDDVRSNGDNLPNEFVADDHGNGDRPACPVIPFIDMDVCAADACSRYPNQDVVDSYGRFGDILEPETFSCTGFYECFHSGIVLDPGREGANLVVGPSPLLARRGGRDIKKNIAKLL